MRLIRNQSDEHLRHAAQVPDTVWQINPGGHIVRRKAALDLLQMSLCMTSIFERRGKQQITKHGSAHLSVKAAETWVAC